MSKKNQFTTKFTPEYAKRLLPFADEADRPRVMMYIDQGGNMSMGEVSQSLGLHRSTLAATMKRLEAKRIEAGAPDDVPVFDPLPSKSGTYDELKEAAVKRSQRKMAYDEAKRWRNITFADNKPIALGFIGDPHVDDDGCDWTQLSAHTQIIKETPGFYASNLGDTTNNWVGRLARLYAHQETTAAQAWILANGWLNELKEKWLMLVRGNHDAWSGSGDPIAWMMSGAPAIDAYEWNVRVALNFPECEPLRIWAAHNFKGHSQYHTLHGMIKARLWHRDPAEIYACGHLHEWGHMSHEPTPRRVVHYVRARGYKFCDSYADDLQFAQQQYGATLTAVIDPTDPGPRRVVFLPSVEEAAEYLIFKQQKRQV